MYHHFSGRGRREDSNVHHTYQCSRRLCVVGPSNFDTTPRLDWTIYPVHYVSVTKKTFNYFFPERVLDYQFDFRLTVPVRSVYPWILLAQTVHLIVDFPRSDPLTPSRVSDGDS